MNKISITKLMLCVAAATSLFSCKNSAIDMEDYDTQAIYFPLQRPVRTLILGEDRYDNSIDKSHAFNIGICVSGMVENTKDWSATYRVNEDLILGSIDGDKANGTGAMVFDDGVYDKNVKVLPAEYYTLSPAPGEKVVIPAGSMSGLIKVQLNDKFFEDGLSVSTSYVIPLELVDASSDILTGEAIDATDENNNKNIAGYWVAGSTPKDFTLFGIKYINPLEGTFFHRGKQFKNTELDEVFYEEDMEANQIARLTTTALHEVEYNRMGERIGDDYISRLSFEDDGKITISAPAGSPYTIDGKGTFYESDSGFAEEHGLWLVDPVTGEEMAWLTIVLDFDVFGLEDDTRYHFMDTLVYRNNNVTYEEFNLLEPSL